LCGLTNRLKRGDAFIYSIYILPKITDIKFHRGITN
jgi:hypothetical protein